MHVTSLINIVTRKIRCGSFWKRSTTLKFLKNTNGMISKTKKVTTKAKKNTKISMKKILLVMKSKSFEQTPAALSTNICIKKK